MRSIFTDFVFMLEGSDTMAILFKATLVLMLGLGIAGVAGRFRASWRHLIFATTFGLLIALPLVIASGFALAIEVPVDANVTAVIGSTEPVADTATVAARSSTVTTSAPSPASNFAMPSLSTVLLAVWFCGAFLLLASLAVDLLRVRGLRRHGLPSQPLAEMVRTLALEANVHRRVDVLLHEGVTAPFTCGWLRPAIVLPSDAAEWSEAELNRAIVHELEHVRRGDWLSQIAARTTCAFYWFHPLVWMAWRNLCLEAERACDDAVVEKAENTQYAEQLVELSQLMNNMKTQTVLGMAKRSDLARRISALLDATQARGRAGAAAAVCSLVVGTFVLVSIGAVRVVAQANETVLIEKKIKAADRGPGSRLNRSLLDAAEEGDLAEIASLLDAGANVNVAVAGDGTPLIAAAKEGQIEAVKLLLERGADVNLGVEGDGNPLIMAAREGFEQIVTLLLDRGAEINKVVPSDENALIQAAEQGHIAVVKLLVERGADVNISVTVERSLGGNKNTPEVRSAISQARKAKQGDVVEYLLSKGARP